ncbi:hypothetical protein E2C01_033510 [Portunus trituberculatus]|uniref:Uncharacterized protein n=1 Tax=Portunus trituberculatus TaxID=210409 RepID=A0A5B7F340_PORTR|nr:hypothetical protein [Portunus trituberculatus]
MDGGSDSDFTVSDSATSPACLTSTPRVSRHVVGRQLLNESVIRKAFEVTVSTIIESEDSDFLGSDTDIGGSTIKGEDIPPPLPATPICSLVVTLMHSYDGVEQLGSGLLHPSMPLTHFRAFFCEWVCDVCCS